MSHEKAEPTGPDVLSQYLAAVRKAIEAIETTQLPAIRQAAERFAGAILAGRLVHVFGTGHSRMAVEEMFPRYGSFPGFHPIVELSMTYHNPVVGANGQRQAMFLENVQGFGPVLWRNFVTTSADVLLAISTSGCNVNAGMPYSRASSSTRSSTRNRAPRRSCSRATRCRSGCGSGAAGATRRSSARSSRCTRSRRRSTSGWWRPRPDAGRMPRSRLA